MWVKICANTNLEDALYAVEAGADAVGFVFAPSKRQLTVEQVRAITDRLPAGVERVGVFAAEAPERIVESAREAGLTSVQLHGGVGIEALGRLREQLGAVSLIHVVHWEVADDAASLARVREQLGLLSGPGLNERVLIDAKMGAVSGGLGVRFDWTKAAAMLAEFPGLRLIVAGGLRPENVSEAVTTFAPYGVDVASGVELSPGRKDHAKVRTFIENARRA